MEIFIDITQEVGARIRYYRNEKKDKPGKAI